MAKWITLAESYELIDLERAVRVKLFTGPESSAEVFLDNGESVDISGVDVEKLVSALGAAGGLELIAQLKKKPQGPVDVSGGSDN